MIGAIMTELEARAADKTVTTKAFQQQASSKSGLLKLHGMHWQRDRQEVGEFKS
jgi:hypothetical protein